MDLLLNTVLNLTKEEIQNSKIEFNMQAGSGGQPFLDRWLKHSEAEKMSGTCSDCSYWGWYGKQRNFYPGQWVFSFARMNDDEWLLISAAEIIDVMSGQVQMCWRDLCRCLTNKDFKDMMGELQKMLLKLQSEVSTNAFDNVRGKMGIKKLADLETLKNLPKTKIMHHKFDKY